MDKKNEKMYDIKDEHTKEEWIDITNICRKNKRKREIKSERLEENERKKTVIEAVSEQQKENERRQ